ncbi:MAG: helix-turn-helix domain-containing protein [Bosea sp. (in: a-proteobacteria)]
MRAHIQAALDARDARVAPRLVCAGERLLAVAGQAPAAAGGRSAARLRVFVAEEFGISIAQLSGRSRRRKFAHPRQMAMYLARTAMGRSYPQIGLWFGRDHTTAIYAVTAVQARLDAGCPKTTALYRAVMDRLEGASHD